MVPITSRPRTDKIIHSQTKETRVIQTIYKRQMSFKERMEPKDVFIY